MNLNVWTLVMMELGAVSATALPVIIATGSEHWWNNFLGRYLVYQSVAFALILLYAGYSQLALQVGWPPLPQSRLVSLAVFTLIASVKVFGVVTFSRVRWLAKRARMTVEASEQEESPDVSGV